MASLEDQLLQLGTVFALVLARVGAMVTAAPLLSDTSIPMRVKAWMAIAMAALVTPMALSTSDTMPVAAGSMIELGILAAVEVVVGLALGLGLMVVLSGVQLTGQIVGQMSGMALAEGGQSAFGDASSIFGQVYYLVTMAVFVAAGGHRTLINGLLDTFETAPPGSGFAIDDVAMSFLGLLGVGFELGVRASAPLLLALFLATVVLGLISRTMPQINTMVVGFGLNAMILLSVMTASLGAVAYVFQAPLANAVESLAGSIAMEADGLGDAGMAE